MIHFGVIESGQQMGRARPAGREADAQLTGEFGVSGRHKGRHLFVTYLNKFDAVAFGVSTLNGAQHPVDAIARIAIDACDTPLFQALDKKITGFHAHRRVSPCSPCRLKA